MKRRYLLLVGLVFLALTNCQQQEKEWQIQRISDHSYKIQSNELQLLAKASEITLQTSFADVPWYFPGSDAVKPSQDDGTLLYPELFNGVDLKIYHKGEAKTGYDFILQPDAKVEDISMFTNGKNPQIDQNGDFTIEVEGGKIRHSAPISYQEIDGELNPVQSRFQLDGGYLNFVLGDYDPSYPVVIDPTVSFEAMDMAMMPLCDCKEYIYLNEVNGTNGKVHKFVVDPSATSISSHLYLREITSTGLQPNPLAQTGTAWYEGSDLPSPHGLGSDLNGFLYIGETSGTGGDIRKLTCDGDLLDEGTAIDEFNISTGGQFNIGSVGNTIYFNLARPLGGGGQGDVTARAVVGFDVCTRNQLGTATFGSLPSGNQLDWGFYVDPRTNLLYATTGFVGDANLYRFTTADVAANNTISPLITGLDNSGDVRGVTTDAVGNIYVVSQNVGSGSGPAQITKYNSAGTFVDDSSTDGSADGTGFNEAIGIVYSEDTDLLFVSTESLVDDCVSVFNTNLGYEGRAVPPPGGSSNAKGIAIKKECCPTAAATTGTIMESICYDGSNSQTIFLQDLLGCGLNASICEGMWSNTVPNASSFSFDPCELSVTVMGGGCTTFELSSVG
ncbi:MAG: hypothetical protein AAF242_18460, partial [Bacteroidota bacterium]